MLAGFSVNCQLFGRGVTKSFLNNMDSPLSASIKHQIHNKQRFGSQSLGCGQGRSFALSASISGPMPSPTYVNFHSFGNSLISARTRTRLFESGFSQLGVGIGLGKHDCKRLGFRHTCKRKFATGSTQSANTQKAKNRATAIYFLSIVVVGVGVAYAAVPLYKMFCQATGFGGTTRQATMDQAKKMVPVKGAHPITVRFAASTSDTLQWKFKPQQREVKVVPGETALAFYTAYNKTDEPIVGVATYNITPLKAGVYFNKIQCFCFDQQRLRPKEEVDMPVFFYIDPEFATDPQMANVRDIVLSYTFFKAK